MDFAFTPEHQRIQHLCRALATDFATRAATHDRAASAPVENYDALRHAGLFGLMVPTDLGGWGAGLLGYTISAEELARAALGTWDDASALPHAGVSDPGPPRARRVYSDGDEGICDHGRSRGLCRDLRTPGGGG